MLSLFVFFSLTCDFSTLTLTLRKKYSMKKAVYKNSGSGAGAGVHPLPPPSLSIGKRTTEMRKNGIGEAFGFFWQKTETLSSFQKNRFFFFGGGE